MNGILFSGSLTSSHKKYLESIQRATSSGQPANSGQLPSCSPPVNLLICQPAPRTEHSEQLTGHGRPKIFYLYRDYLLTILLKQRLFDKSYWIECKVICQHSTAAVIDLPRKLVTSGN